MMSLENANSDMFYRVSLPLTINRNRLYHQYPSLDMSDCPYHHNFLSLNLSMFGATPNDFMITTFKILSTTYSSAHPHFRNFPS